MNIYKDIMQDIEMEKAKAQNEQDMRKQQVYASIPRIQEIDQQISDIGIKFARLALGAKDIDREIEQLKSEIFALKEERQTLLKARYSANYLELQNICSQCQDIGHVNGIRCRCIKSRIINKYLQISGFGNVLEYENFDHFDLRYFSEEKDIATGISPREQMQGAFKAAMDFVYNFDVKYTNLLFYGGAGLGKTFLCHCIAKDTIDRGIPVLYTTANRLAKNMENARFNKEEHDPTELELYYTSPLLIIDDLGTEFSTIVTQSEIFDVINNRLMGKRATVISTNFSYKDMQDVYSERIVSRLFGEYKTFKFIGNDIRIAKKAKVLEL
ncbi:MAG: ATP-binding protein [Defluviitaleaceae bacterium]|nr:ATP-binding protein [Defluviitaleaceae bacterium]